MIWTLLEGLGEMVEKEKWRPGTFTGQFASKMHEWKVLNLNKEHISYSTFAYNSSSVIHDALTQQ